MDNSTLKIKQRQALGMNLLRFISIILMVYCVAFSGVKSDTSYISGGSYTGRLHTPSAGITRANMDTSHTRHATADSATIPVLKGNAATATTATSVNSTNYNSYSTTTSGWSSTSYAYVYWHRIGSVVFVLFSIQGTSNSNIATFTLPYSSIVQANFVCNYQDNGGSYQVGYGYTSGNVVYICAGNWGGDYNAFTPSGNKHVLGSFIYFAK